MKKLIAFIFCLAVLATVARAEYPQQQGRDTLNKQVSQRAEQAQLERKVVVQLIMTVQSPLPNDERNLKTQYNCSGVIVNAAGDVAIKKDCLPAIRLADKNHRSISLHIDMRNLGKYRNTDDFFYYETSDATADTFVVKENFIVYALPLKPNSQVKTALNNVFKDTKGLTAQRVTQLLQNLSKAKVSNYI